MELPALLQTYGYALLAVGCLLEGETVLVLAGFAAHEGHLDFTVVVMVAAIAGFSGDLAFYWLGRRHGAALLARFPSIAAQADRVHRLLDRWHGWVIVFVRFAYGLRIAGPVIIGSSGVAPARFALFNAIGASLWAVTIASAGWFFGRAVQTVLGEIHRFELWALGLAALGAALWLLWLLRRTRAGRQRRR
ncbi:MAG: DedA family protein [Burkholderiaceae bacterium]|jgi:membrane protein DedA with SNARE-associated domain|nr:DedA family protein [Burkholderiaceae bacterium]